MDTKLEKCKKRLEKYNQEHLLDFYDELSENEREQLLNQILKINFKKVNKVYEDSYKDDSISSEKITPIDYIVREKLSKKEIEKYQTIGEEIIKIGEVAVITLAGGQGTRLGYKGPKGCYEIDVPPKKSLFEFLCDKLKKTYSDYGTYLNWYIMTSPENDLPTKAYFKEKKYFEYPKEKIFFFKQSTFPLVDKEGKILLDKLYSIKMASNGNGDVFKAFKKSKLQDTISKINWFSISGIDNILLEIVDPVYLGIAAYNKTEVASKSIAKEDINSKEYVFAKVDGRTDIIEPKNLSENQINSKNKDGKYNYNQANILSHLFTKKAFIDAMDVDFRYHRAFKKNDYINNQGVKVVATERNSFKFEKFIFDVFKQYDKFTLLEVKREDEFAPIKAFTGNDTPETALSAYQKKILHWGRVSMHEKLKNLNEVMRVSGLKLNIRFCIENRPQCKKCKKRRNICI